MDYEKEKAKMIEEAEKSLITIDGVIYDKRFNDLVSYPKSKEKEEFVVPDGTVSIRQNAFAEVENLKRLEMPSSVVRIGERAFYKSKVETVILSDNIEIIEKSSFEHCKELSTVNIPKNIDEIYLLSLVEKVKNAGAVGINFNYKNASKELVEVFRNNGLLVSIWTVDTEFNMYKILSFQPDNITTRHPDKLSEIVNKMQVKF